MHGATIKIINAQQARLNIYKTTKLKLLKTNAAIWFNKICRDRQLKPKYISFKINGRKQQDKRTTTNAIRFRINQEIKFLYKKKQHLNQQLYQTQLECANQHSGMWQHIQNYIDQQINKIMERVHLPPCTRNNVHKYRICCHNNIITKKFIFLTRDFS